MKENAPKKKAKKKEVIEEKVVQTQVETNKNLNRRAFLAGAGSTAIVAGAGLAIKSFYEKRMDDNKDKNLVQKSLDENKVQRKLEKPKTNPATNENLSYKRPRPGETILLREANFSIFPEKLGYNFEKKTLVVSNIWQTACLYNKEGTKYLENGKPVQFQVGTGKPGHETPLGFYGLKPRNTDKADEKGNYNQNYKSSEFSLRGKKGRFEEGGPMPYAMHLQQFYYNHNGEKIWLPERGIAIHGRSTVTPNSTVANRSHGCIGAEIFQVKNLQHILNKDDQVLVIGENMPMSTDSSQKTLII